MSTPERSWRHLKRDESSERSRKRDRTPKVKEERRSLSPPKKEKKSKKEKKKKKRRRSSSSSSDSSVLSDTDPRFQEKLEAEREEASRIKAMRKERMKAQETPEEKRARRLAKKLAKENKTKTAKGWGEEFMGYSNVDNPFGDAKLTQTFLWGKKLERDGLADKSRAEVEGVIRNRVAQNREELERFKKARAEREAIREEMEMIRRDEEMAQHHEWLKQEDGFHLRQARQRSRIRIKERRAKPIDFLARYAGGGSDEEEEEEELIMEVQEPEACILGLSIRDLEDLLADIDVMRKLEGSDANASFWADVERLAEEELKRQRGQEDEASGRRRGIHGAVAADIEKIIKGKTYHQLALLETQIRKKIHSGAQGVDVGYWETLLGQLKTHMARQRLKDRHQDFLREKAQKLQQEQGVKVEPKEETESEVVSAPDEPEQPPLPEDIPSSSSADIPSSSTAEPEADFKRPAPVSGKAREALLASLPWSKLTEEERAESRYTLYEEGSYSPVYMRETDVPPAVELMEPSQDLTNVRISRAEKKNKGSATSVEDRMEAEVLRSLGTNDDERGFSVETPVEQKSYLWSDKYKPRKPRYFNRVHTGFEWNKYNQTHYDLENPPPKIVQGYKFNIFYPDLLDPSVPPEFGLFPCDDPDFAILRFKAGPPYEDIAFKVVCREWESNHKRGYKCQFQNGIFQLWFHFKRWRYRR